MNRYVVGLKNFSFCGVFAERFEFLEEYNELVFFVGDNEVAIFEKSDIFTIDNFKIVNDDIVRETVFQEEDDG